MDGPGCQRLANSVHFVDIAGETPIGGVVGTIRLAAIELIPGQEPAVIAERGHRLERFRVSAGWAAMNQQQWDLLAAAMRPPEDVAPWNRELPGCPRRRRLREGARSWRRREAQHPKTKLTSSEVHAGPPHSAC